MHSSSTQSLSACREMNHFKLLLFLTLLYPPYRTVADKRSLEIDDLKSDLLNLLEVKEKPAISRSRWQVPRYVIELYRKQAFIDGFTKNGHSTPGRTVRTFFRDEQDKKGPHKHLFTFNISAMRPAEKVEHAEIRIFKRRSSLPNPRALYKVTVSRLTKPWSSVNKRWKRKLVALDVQLVKCRKVGEWITFNVTSAVKFWSKYPSKNYGLWVSVRSYQAPPSDFKIATGGRKDPILVEFGVDREKLQKAQMAEIQDELQEKKHALNYKVPNVDDLSRDNSKIIMASRTRSRRDVADNLCRRHRLFVKFQELNWSDWILAPRGFSAYYCTGTCPEVIEQYFNPTNHAIIQNLLHHRYSKSVPAACCVPTRLHSISMLYFELDGSIVLKEYGEMVAASCGCR
ncbi:bone morphogenetic protein 2 [Nematostella vectensis]|uniref:bone morphogenetic protein 2 n=1 Tax=Nematostella vectensis TaxID=45351 RepID=UPI00207779E0|nr:bone morphogenetic protein 2 [Nematostella vectensis]